MVKQTKREKKLQALRVVCETIMQLTKEADADPTDLHHRLLGVLLLMDPKLRRPQSRREAIERLTELTLIRLKEAAAAYDELIPEGKHSLS